MQALEHHERVEISSHAGHGDHGAGNNRRVALLIMVLAALLAIVEMMGKSAQNDYLASHIEASNLWSFFQAKTVRQTVLKTIAEDMETRPKQTADIQGGIDKKMEKFYATIDRYEDEPSTGEGRKQLVQRARETEVRRDRALAAYHYFEYAAAALQLAIVLASAAVITGIGFLTWSSAGLGGIGVLLGALPLVGG